MVTRQGDGYRCAPPILRAADIRNRRRQVSGRAVIAHRCDQAERVDDLRRLVVDRIVAIGRNQGSQRRARLWC